LHRAPKRQVLDGGVHRELARDVPNPRHALNSGLHGAGLAKSH
jgi:hypothetical protein